MDTLAFEHHLNSPQGHGRMPAAGSTATAGGYACCDEITVSLEVRGDQVRLGIRAPRSIDVHREEVFANLQQANQAAARSARDLAAHDAALPGAPATSADK